MTNKYHLKCVGCGHITEDFNQWFKQNQKCPKCGSKHSEVWYDNADYNKLEENFDINAKSFWQYFDYLPLEDKKNIISCNEGAIPLENWTFLEEFAQEFYNVKCKVHVYRNDLNGGTGTFKDVAASLAASIFKENNIKQYTVASTGNTATAYSRYLAIAGVNSSVFIPNNALEASESEINSYGQRVYRADGDYAFAKKLAAEYAADNNILISGGNVDPIRVEAKKTMVFEWFRQIGGLPDVYVQAISGGTGPIAIDKAIKELEGSKYKCKIPRYIMIQPDKCDPMVRAWEKAVANDFPEGYQNDYPIIDDPQTEVPTLATGNPATYPIIAKLVKDSNGCILRIPEDKLIDVAKFVAFEKHVHLGPAGAVCMAGFIKALQEGKINNGDSVLVNTGEGVRRAPDFMSKIKYTTVNISKSSECKPHQKSDFKAGLWNAVKQM